MPLTRWLCWKSVPRETAIPKAEECAEHVKPLMQVKAFQTICLQRRGALQRVKDALAKVDFQAPEARLLAAREALRVLRKRLHAVQARPGASGATEAVGAGEDLRAAAGEAATPPAETVQPDVQQEVCNSKVQRTADVWKAEAARLSLALAERRRLNDCLKLEAFPVKIVPLPLQPTFTHRSCTQNGYNVGSLFD